MSKIAVLLKAARLARIGASLKSGAVLFSLVLLNQVGFQRHWLRNAITWIVRRCGREQVGYIRLFVRMPCASRRWPVAIRTDDPSDYLSVCECFGGTTYQLPKRLVKYIIDGGANIGLFSVYAAGHLGVPILAVEPAPKNLALLEYNVASIPGVRIINAALSAVDGTAKFNLATSNTGHLAKLGTGNSKLESCEVRTTRLESILPKDWELAYLWLKLDIEGAEYEVLRNAFDLGIRPAVISAEIHDYFGANGAGLVAELESLNYSVLIEGGGDSGNVCRLIHAELR